MRSVSPTRSIFGASTGCAKSNRALHPPRRQVESRIAPAPGPAHRSFPAAPPFRRPGSPRDRTQFQFAEQMAVDEDRRPALLERCEHIANLPPPHRIDAIGRLIQHDQIRIVHHRLRQADALHHPFGVSRDFPSAHSSCRRCAAARSTVASVGRENVDSAAKNSSICRPVRYCGKR